MVHSDSLHDSGDGGRIGALKTIIAAFFASCVVSLAQPTNVDPSTGMPQWPADGKITDTNLLVPVSFTNSIGNFITDAIPARLFANKLIYITANGGGGTIRLDRLPEELRERFGYNERMADLAEKNDRIKKEREDQIHHQQLQAIREQAKWGVQNCTARPFLYPQRALGESWRDLQPLFNWWAYVSRLTSSVAQTNLPAKPYIAWNRIVALDYTTNESFWILDATIQTTPNAESHAKVYLLHPPNTEKRKFDAARAELMAVNRERSDLAFIQQGNNADLSAVNNRANDVDFYRSHSGQLNNQLAGAAADLSRQGNQILQNQQSVANKQSALEARAAELVSYLNSFQNPSHYVLDFFAFDTGKTINEMEVYDLGYIYGQ